MSSIVGALGAVEAVLGPLAVSFNRPQPERLDAVVRPDDLLTAVRALVNESWGYLSAIVGLDHPAPVPVEGEPTVEGAIEVLYTFCNDAAIAIIRTTLPYSQAVLPTISGLLPSAMLYEWELREMFGVEVIGLPVTGHLILADDWPDGVYPLRKAFVGFNGKEQSQ